MVVATLGLVLGLFAAVMPSATAGPVDAGWTAAGPGTVQTVSDGSASAAAMTYNGDGLGSASWTFTTTATPTSANGTPIRVPWTWQGLHAWFLVTAQMDAVVIRNGVEISTTNLVNEGPEICCTEPSNGFLYGGIHEFNVQPGDVYGFRLRGSNGDYNNFLRGTFTLSTKPYIDATIGTDNRQWIGATEISTATLPATTAGYLEEPGEARWYKFRVVPGQQATVSLTSPADYDLALYGDIGNAYDQLASGADLTQLAAASAAGAPGSETQTPVYDPAVTTIPTTETKPPVTTQFAPRIYAPRIYAPRIYAPRIYAPRIYAPRIYAPRIYAPDSFVPDLESNTFFRDAFSAAQNQTLLAMSANTDLAAETVSASTGNTDGYFYVRVQGATDQAFDAGTPFSLRLNVTGGESCRGLQTFETTPTIGTSGNPAAVIVTDTNKLMLSDGSQAQQNFLSTLGSLATRTGGVVVDVRTSARVRALQDQVATHPTCPYATNLVAREIQSIVDRYRGDATKYVVIAGGDDVIPFFRYPDTSGLGQESQFEPPVNPNTPAGASLDNDQVLGQDAYGSDTEVTISGLTMPVPDLAVGRLVKTPGEISATVDHYLGLQNGTLPAPTSSLVTGYDFLADAAGAVGQEFATALPRATDRNDQLITPAGTPYSQSWTATQLKQALFTGHDLVYLAGHFSANDTLAADFTTTFGAEEIAPTDPVSGAPTPANGLLTDTLVLSAGCHSGYNVVDSAAVIGQTDTYDWTQAMAQQQAVLIGGTGYQYGDTDFLEYSERLYLGITQRLREGPVGVDSPPVAVGRALALAKQDYLAGVTTLEGIDQKAVLQATLYGLPMTGFDAPGRAPVRSEASLVPSQLPTVDGGPGETLGLETHDLLDLATGTEAQTKASGAGSYGLPTLASWRKGDDGVAVQPGAPALPKQLENVTVPDRVLRGVGFRGGDYTDTTGLLPLTGAPAIEGSTTKTTFESPVFWPQRIITPNYFGALGASGRTSLVLTPAQYRNDPASTENARTNVERAYSDLDLRLYYSGESSTRYGTNQPALATAPAIGEVTAVSNGELVKFSARVTGDPSAGVQEVWVTWTGTGNDSGHGHWKSIDLAQSADDSTLWTAVRELEPGQTYQGMRFLVQAANGVGSVGMDTGTGDGYSVVLGDVAAPKGSLALLKSTPDSDSPLGIRAKVTDEDTGSPLPGRTVTFTVTNDQGELLSQVASVTSSDGTAVAQYAGAPPAGLLNVRADLYGLGGELVETEITQVEIKGRSLSVDQPWLATRAGTDFPALTATLLDEDGLPVVGVLVNFKLPSSGAGATFPDGSKEVAVRTDALGHATAPTMRATSTVGSFQVLVSAFLARTGVSVPMASQYAFTPFESPVDNNGTLTRSPSANTPVAAAALLADGSRISDGDAATLVRNGRVQLRFRVMGADLWSPKTAAVSYDAVEKLFRANLKAPTLGMSKGTTYEVQLRVLATEPRPVGEPLQSAFDLGHRSFLIYLK